MAKKKPKKPKKPRRKRALGAVRSVSAAVKGSFKHLRNPLKYTGLWWRSWLG